MLKKRMTQQELEAEKERVRNKIWHAYAKEDFKEVNKLEAKLIWLDKKIRKGKK